MIKKDFGEEFNYTANIKYKIIYKKIKNIYIQIKDGNVIVKAPKYSNISYIENIVRSKSNWILKKINEQPLKSKNNYKDNSIISVLGKRYTLKIIYTDKKRSRIYQDQDFVYCELGENIKNNNLNEQKSIERLLDKYYKTIASREIPEIMESLYKRTGLKPLECNIKKLKSTWGICSSKKKISINQNLMAYSRHAIEYVCLHEICHLKYMNHSKEFWNMVEYYMPDYKLAKNELKS
ncbi:MAG: M48 family metallopeptidase [Clostridia bacterium]